VKSSGKLQSRKAANTALEIKSLSQNPYGGGQVAGGRESLDSRMVLGRTVKKEPQRNHGNDVDFSSLRGSVVVQILVFSGG